MKKLSFAPRFIRAGDAGSYLGMNRNRFNAEVRPNLTEIPIGKRGVAFDRLELDVWADWYMSQHGRQHLGSARSMDTKRVSRDNLDDRTSFESALRRVKASSGKRK